MSGFSGKYNARFGSGFVGEFVFGDGMKTFDQYFSDEDVKRAQNGMSKDEYMAVLSEMLKSGENDKINQASKRGNVNKPWWQPDCALIVADSKFRRNKGSEYRKAFLNKTKFYAYVDYRMSEAAQYADILLPAKSHYEVYDLRTSPGYHRFTNLAQPFSSVAAVRDRGKSDHLLFGQHTLKVLLYANSNTTIRFYNRLRFGDIIICNCRRPGAMGTAFLPQHDFR